MSEQELIQLTNLLEKFIKHCDMPEMELMHKAEELLELINNK